MDKITSDVPRQQWFDIIQACNAMLSRNITSRSMQEAIIRQL